MKHSLYVGGNIVNFTLPDKEIGDHTSGIGV